MSDSKLLLFHICHRAPWPDTSRKRFHHGGSIMHRLSRRSFIAGCAPALMLAPVRRRSRASHRLSLRCRRGDRCRGPLAGRQSARKPFPVRHRRKSHRRGRTHRGQGGHASRARRHDPAVRHRAADCAPAAHLSQPRLRPDVRSASDIARHADRSGVCGRIGRPARGPSKSSRAGCDPMPRTRSTARREPARRPILPPWSSPGCRVSTFATCPIAAPEPRCPISWADASRCTSRRHPN